MTSERPDLRGRVALVTGASRGIGREVAIGLAAGAAVAVTARTTDPEPDAPLPGSLSETAVAIRGHRVPAFALGADLTDETARAGIVAAVADALGPVDILVNNAAAALYAPAAAMPLRRRRLLFEVNVHAPVDLIQLALPSMRANRRGSIVNVSSAAAGIDRAPATTMTPYGASKAGLERFTVGLAEEVRDDGIAVNAIAPVVGVRTPGAAAVLGERYEQLAERFEPVERIVAAVVHLAGCTAADCTGQVLTTADPRFIS